MSIILWLRSDRGVTTVSGKVSAWAHIAKTYGDASVIQSTAGNRPVYTNDGTGQLGRPFLNFNSADSTYLAGAWTGWTVGAGTYMAMVVNHTSTAGTQYGLDIVDGGGGTQTARVVLANGSAAMYGRCLLGAVDENTGTAAATTGAQVIEVFRNSTTDKLELWRAGVRLSQSAAVATNTVGTASGSIAIGRELTAATNHFDGHLYEVVIANADPTNTQLAQLSDYFHRRYGLKSCAALAA